MKHFNLQIGLAIACLAAASVASAQSSTTDRSAVKAENKPAVTASKSTTAATAATTPAAVRTPIATTAVAQSMTNAEKPMSKQGSYEGCHGSKQVAEADL
jgi:hypothetical protein